MNLIKHNGRHRLHIMFIPIIGIGIGYDTVGSYRSLVILLPFVSIELGIEQKDKNELWKHPQFINHL